MKNVALGVLLSLLIISCQTKTEKEPSIFESVPAEKSGVDFFNKVENSKDFNVFLYRNFYNGGGVGIADINNDSLPDIYFTSNMGSNKLYLNKGNFQFEDITEKAGVGSPNKWSTGVTMVDFNADGWMDIYISNAGYRKGGDQRNELYLNNGDLTFTEKAADYHLDQNGYSTHAAFFDYDRDGDLDVYILNNSFMPVNTLNYSNKRELVAEDWPVKDFLKGGGDKLMRNDGESFTDVTVEANIYSSLIGFGLGVTVGDVNHDGWPDLYISNDFFERDYLYINQQDGTFSEQIKDFTGHISNFSMGADMADINNDNWPDIFVTDMLPGDDVRLKTTTNFEPYPTYRLKLDRDFYHQYMQNTLQVNSKGAGFKEVAHYAGVSASDWSWGALMFDVNNDGLKDIYVSNGIYHDVTDQDFIDFFANDVVQQMALTGKKEELDNIINKMPSTPIPNKLFINQGELGFKDVSADQLPTFSNGSAYADLDGDGDLDLVINNVNQPSMILENKTSGANYIKVSLVGEGKNNRGIGTKVQLFTSNGTQTLEQIPSRGFQSSVDYTLVFGLGKLNMADSLVVTWPTGSRQTFSDLKANSTLTLFEKDAASSPKVASLKERQSGLFEKVNLEFPAHSEDEYVDYYKEGLVIKGLSKEGPAIAIGDINQDGLDDLFLGGAKGQAGQLLLQTPNGSFELVDLSILNQHSFFEDTEAQLFDADQDGDLDLFVGSGGNAAAPFTMEFQDRLYLNDGKGSLTLYPQAFPNNGFNTAFSLTIDFDADGKTDLLVGSRSFPGEYAKTPKSYLYHNQGNGNFKEVTADKIPQFESLGMLTDAEATNLDNDPEFEIVVTGEWMSPKVFDWKGDHFELVNTGLENYSGWWNCVTAADLDQDGDLDLLLGNRGENFYFTGSVDAPAKLWVYDFDQNGTTEKIITQQLNGKDVTVHLKKELTNQLSVLKKKSLKHAEFATKSIQDIFPKDQLRKATVLGATYFKSAVAYNQGDGSFKMEALPFQAQLSSVRDILITDLNTDQLPDFVLVGNDFDFLPQYGRLDASRGEVFLNRGKGTYEYLTNREAGFMVTGASRRILPLQLGKEKAVIVGINNEKPQVFKLIQQ